MPQSWSGSWKYWHEQSILCDHVTIFAVFQDLCCSLWPCHHKDLTSAILGEVIDIIWEQLESWSGSWRIFAAWSPTLSTLTVSLGQASDEHLGLAGDEHPGQASEEHPCQVMMNNLVRQVMITRPVKWSAACLPSRNEPTENILVSIMKNPSAVLLWKTFMMNIYNIFFWKTQESQHFCCPK